MIRLFILLFIPLIAQAQNGDGITPTAYNGQQIHFGNGGGFVGIETTFVLLDDGNLFKKQSFADSFQHVVLIDSIVSDSIFLEYKSLELNKLNINKPGNIYKFVEHHQNNQSHKLVWSGKSGHEKPDYFYKRLKSLTKIE